MTDRPSPAPTPQVPGSSASRPLRTFLVVMLMFGIITSLHGMSPLATYGLGAVFFLLLATIW